MTTSVSAIEMEVPGPVAEWEAGLGALHRRIARRFRRAEARARARRYLRGLLGPARAQERLAAGRAPRRADAARRPAPAQRRPTGTPTPSATTCAPTSSRRSGDPDGVLIVDETGFLKKGTKSVGVQRQYSGTAGRIENCQVGVFLAYATARGCAFLDRALYLPKEWAEDADAPGRGRACPTEVAFATKPELARAMLARAFAAGVPAAWVVGDAVYGGDELRRWLEGRGQPYVLAVACTHGIWTGGPAGDGRGVGRRAARRRLGAAVGGRRQPGAALVRLGLPGAAVRGGAPGMAHWLLVRRSLSDPTERAYYRVYGPAGTPRGGAGAGGRRPLGDRGAFEEAKGEVGLDQYEVRRWDGWHRHVTLALLAHAFLVATRARPPATAEKGAVTP